MIEVGENIKKLRELKNYTQEYMAQQLNMSSAGYGKIERNETDISLKRLDEIAKILETSIAHILNFDEKHFFYNIHTNTNSPVGNTNTATFHLNEKLIEHLENEIIYLRTENSKLIDIIAKTK